MKRASIALCAILVATSASAQGLEGLLGQVQNKAKATAFDAAVESQAPGLSGITSNLSDSQKAQLFDLGVDNAGTIGQVAAGAGALGAATGLGTSGTTPAPSTGIVSGLQPVQPQGALVQPYLAGQQPSAYGAVQPMQPAPMQPAPVQPAPVQPAYGTAVVQPAQPLYGTTVQPIVPQGQSVYGVAEPQPAYGVAPSTAQTVYGTTAQPTVPVQGVTTGQQVYVQPSHQGLGTATGQPLYVQPPAPQPSVTDQLIGTAVQMGIDALSQ